MHAIKSNGKVNKILLETQVLRTGRDFMQAPGPMKWKIELIFCTCTNQTNCAPFQGTKCFLLLVWMHYIAIIFLALWTLKVAQGGIFLGKQMWKQEIALGRVEERQKQAQVGRGRVESQ